MTSVITCPSCAAKTEAVIPENACQFFWDCPACKTVLRPKHGDCCVFCSYGDRRCPTAGDCCAADPTLADVTATRAGGSR